MNVREHDVASAPHSTSSSSPTLGIVLIALLVAICVRGSVRSRRARRIRAAWNLADRSEWKAAGFSPAEQSERGAWLPSELGEAELELRGGPHG